MLRNCDKMVLLSSTPPNEWPLQNNHIDDPKTSFNSVMDHPKVVGITQDQHQQQQQQQQQNQEALRCPRCDSTNTKFCYYNNYSLTQPRHFCKACKRYWTRGGTLRNVPVGGGCRKNKRVKRPSSSSSTSLEVNSGGGAGGGGGGGGGGLSSIPHGSHIQDLINGHNHPLFYGLPTNNSEMNFPFSRYDLQNPPQINGLGLGFSSGLVHNMNTMNIHNTNNNHHNHPQNTKQIFQDLISSSSNPIMLNTPTTTTTNNNIASSSSTKTTNTTSNNTTTISPSISSLLASSLHQMKGGTNNFQTLFPSYEDELHMKATAHHHHHHHGGMFNKEVKMEFEGHHQNRSLMHHHHWNINNHQNQMDQTIAASSSPDPASILWGTNNAGSNFGTWLDPSNNIGSSVPSLI